MATPEETWQRMIEQLRGVEQAIPRVTADLLKPCPDGERGAAVQAFSLEFAELMQKHKTVFEAARTKDTASGMWHLVAHQLAFALSFCLATESLRTRPESATPAPIPSMTEVIERLRGAISDPQSDPELYSRYAGNWGASIADDEGNVFYILPEGLVGPIFKGETMLVSREEFDRLMRDIQLRTRASRPATSITDHECGP